MYVKIMFILSKKKRERKKASLKKVILHKIIS